MSGGMPSFSRPSSSTQRRGNEKSCGCASRAGVQACIQCVAEQQVVQQDGRWDGTQAAGLSLSCVAAAGSHGWMHRAPHL